MAYLGRIDDLSKVAPNHPFAHTCIIIGGQRPPASKTPLPIGRHGVIVAVKWENEDWHAVVIGATRWRHIRHGEKVMARSKYWNAGKWIPCHWHFNENGEHSLKMDYRIDEGFGYCGDIRDVHIVEMAPGK